MGALDKVTEELRYPGGLIPFAAIQPFMGSYSQLEILNSRHEPKIVHAEIDDPVYSMKVLDVDLDKLLVIKREGFNDIEVSDILNFIRDNKEVIKRNNGVDNA